MSHLNNGDWDLCWWFNSDTGCRNSHCTWRHEKFPDGHYQIHKQKFGNFHRRCTREKPNAALHPVNQHSNGRINDQYRLQNPNIYNDNRANHKYELWSKLLHKLQSQYCDPVSNSMSESSSVKMPDQISNANSMSTSPGGSDPDCDIFKNFMNVSTGEQTMVQKPNSKGFVQDVHTKLHIPRNPGKKSQSVLSPFARVFVPSVEKLALRESTAFAGEMAYKLPNYNSGRIIMGKVYE